MAITCVNIFLLGCFLCLAGAVMSEKEEYYVEDLEECIDIEDSMEMLQNIKKELQDQKVANEKGLETLREEIKSLSRPDTCKDNDQGPVVLHSGVEVVCDGSWIVLMRRRSAQVSFDRNWADYTHGFGDLRNNFWYGLEKMHALTSNRRYEVRFQMTFNGNTYYAGYDRFIVAGESDNYRLTITGYDAYKSTVSDRGFAMSRHNGKMFTTKDKDNDNWRNGNCANGQSGGWWYDDEVCHTVKFTGVWGSNTGRQGVNWREWTGTASATSAEIKIRPLYF